MITGTRHITSAARVSCLIAVLALGRASAAPIFVDSTATGGNNDGTNWTNAYLDLQDAINQAWSNPTAYPEIRVAQGRYKPDGGTFDPSLVFHLVNNVQIKGGYGGLRAANPDDRNIPRYETILSGDLNGNDTPCDVYTNRGDNSYTVVTGTEPDDFTVVDATAVIEGFTITGAYSVYGGSGIFLDATASPTIRSCKISYNNAPGGVGAGIYCSQDARPFVQNCTIEGNEAKVAGGIVLSSFANALIDGCRFVRNKSDDLGGGIYLNNSAAPTIQQCTFEANQSGQGGAMSISSSSVDTRPTIKDCKFINNEVFTNGGNGGGAIVNRNRYPFVVVNCLFTGNKSHNGGGGGAVLNDAATTSQFVNCAFSRNTVDGVGGAIYNRTTVDASTLTLINCSFSSNSATIFGGGVYGASQATLVIRNSLFWGNTSIDSTTLAKQISTAGPPPTVSYSSIQGCSSCFGGNGNNDNPPSFVNAATDNLRLKSTSLVIDSADNCQISGTVTTDLDGTGHSRRIDDSTSNTGVDCTSPPPPTPVTWLDRGAYEFSRSLDCNGNNVNDNDDIAGGFSDDCNHDGIPDECLAPCLKGDVNHDGLVNGQDIQAMVNRLLGASTCAFGDCESDVNSDNAVNIADIPCFANVLLGYTDCAYTCPVSGGSLRSPDCNGNGVNDANDIANGTSLDCNQNFIPDECDIAAETSADVNGNGIPDECELDCNHNGIPDAWDISQSTSNDVDADGIPDECETDCNHNGLPDGYDIAQQTSADCNANGIPDECESDCNANGVPDDCDTDPNDPDGNGLVSPDCNHNEYPDECDLAMGPPFGSLDCNENGVPDECDIASGYSQDVNANQIPDECEGGAFGGDSPMQGGGETWDGNSGGTPLPQTPEEVEAAWQAFYEWAVQQCWGQDCEATPAEQFQHYADKLAELGLPLVGAQ